MKVINLEKNNIHSLSVDIEVASHLGIAGLSGSGKTTFCSSLHDEFNRRLVSLLPRSERDFLFKDQTKTNFGALDISGIPPIKFFHQDAIVFSPRSTIGTHSGLYKVLRRHFSRQFNVSSQFFSFNVSSPENQGLICEKCKGRGIFGGRPCPQCSGLRYTNKIKNYCIQINGKKFSLVDLAGLSFERLRPYSSKIGFEPSDVALLDAFIDLDLGYLSLSRTISTLSGGELTRIQLAEAVSRSDRNLIIVDELSHGLDVQTQESVVGNLASIAQTNTLWLIDHSEVVQKALPAHLYFGPGSGENGGKIVPKSPRPAPVFHDSVFEAHHKFFVFERLVCRNLDIDHLEVPVGAIVAITGKSGCGKSTLVRDCIIPQMAKRYRSVEILCVDQNKAKLVTSASTVSTFLGVSEEINKAVRATKKKCPFCLGAGNNAETGECEYCGGTGIASDYLNAKVGTRLKVGDFFTKTISELIPDLPSNLQCRKALENIQRLGIAHLSLSRTVRSLSAGEYQALYLVACLSRMRESSHYLLVLDEPTKGLSQNIVNQLMETLHQIQNTFSATILYIEHSPYMLESADYVIDFGKTREANVRRLTLYDQEQWKKATANQESLNGPSLPARSTIPRTGLRDLRKDASAITAFNQAQTQFYSFLKSLSSTASWKYSTFSSSLDVPVVALNLGSSLFSDNSTLFDIADTAARIVSTITDSPRTRSLFDFKNTANRCLSCKGSGFVSSIDFSLCVNDESCSWNTGFLNATVTEALRNYNFSRVSRMFMALKKVNGFDLAKPISQLTSDEHRTLLYGDWHYLLPGKEGRTYHWRGLNFLIQKYMKESKSPLKDDLKESLHTITCPVCGGRTLQHKGRLPFHGKDVGEWFSRPLKECCSAFGDVAELVGLSTIFGDHAVLNARINMFTRVQRACAKIYELKMCRFSGMTIYLRNLPRKLPEYAHNWILDIAKDNEVIVCSDADLPDEIKNSDILKRMGLSESAFVYQLFGIPNLDKAFKRLKRDSPCRSCKGRGVVDINSDNEDFYNLTEPCAACAGSGIDKNSQDKVLEGVRVGALLNGDLHAIDPRYPEGLSLPLVMRIRDLSADQLEVLLSGRK